MPRRIGLSATMDDYETAIRWLKADTKRGVEVVNPAGNRKLLLAVEHFSLPSARNEEEAKDLENARKSYLDYVYDHTHTKKSLIFTNSRTDAEEITRAMRAIAAKRAERDVFYVHHGSISGHAARGSRVGAARRQRPRRRGGDAHAGAGH